MKITIQHVRNATMIIEWGNVRLLVDPMLGSEKRIPSLTFLRGQQQRNPTVPLPANIKFDNITSALLTHRHFDHIDGAGLRLLAEQQIPTYCNEADEAFLKRSDVPVHPVQAGAEMPFFGGTIKAIPTQHGFGLLGRLMGTGVGYMLRLPDAPSIYLSGDTVLTPTVREVLEREQPDIAVVAAGGAQFDIGKPILMPLDEVIAFAHLAPKYVIANHLGAINHCQTTRDDLRLAAELADLSPRLYIPEDGAYLSFGVEKLISPVPEIWREKAVTLVSA